MVAATLTVAVFLACRAVPGAANAFPRRPPTAKVLSVYIRLRGDEKELTVSAYGQSLLSRNPVQNLRPSHRPSHLFHRKADSALHTVGGEDFHPALLGNKLQGITHIDILEIKGKGFALLLRRRSAFRRTAAAVRRIRCGTGSQQHHAAQQHSQRFGQFTVHRLLPNRYAPIRFIRAKHKAVVILIPNAPFVYRRRTHCTGKLG